MKMILFKMKITEKYKLPKQQVKIIFIVMFNQQTVILFIYIKYKIMEAPHQQELFIFQDDQSNNQQINQEIHKENESQIHFQRQPSIHSSAHQPMIDQATIPQPSPSFKNFQHQSKIVQNTRQITTKMPQSKKSSFVQQNAYSFRNNPTISQPKNIQTEQLPFEELEIISDLDSQYSQQNAKQSEKKTVNNEIKNNNRSNRRSKSRFNDINDEQTVKSNKIEDKMKDLHKAEKMGPNLFHLTNNQQIDNHKTEDHLAHKKINPIERIETMNKIAAVPKPRQELPPIRSSKINQNYISSSSIVADQSSMVVMKDENRLAPLNMSSLTQMAKFQNDDLLKISKRYVPLSKTLKCRFSRSKQCFLNFCSPQFSLFLRKSKFMMNAKQVSGWIGSKFNITCQQKDFTDKNDSFIGYLTKNFSGSTFNLYQTTGKGDVLICTIKYQIEFTCSSTFRKIQVFHLNNDTSFSSLYGATNKDCNLKELYQMGQNASQKKIVKLINKQPEWNEEHGQYYMNFKGKCKMASVKNMVLINEQDPLRYVLLLCKMEKHSFYTEISHPLSPFIAMGIIISCFDFKLFCQ